jgi:hypothetical protein
MPADAPADACPDCGERMTPVLDRTPTPPEAGPLSHDSPVRLECRACPATADLRVE